MENSYSINNSEEKEEKTDDVLVMPTRRENPNREVFKAPNLSCLPSSLMCKNQILLT